jgi:hypothetical protein
MIQRTVVYFSSLLIALATAFLVLILSKIIPLVNALPLGISLLALIVSILSSFKNELFPFRLSVFSDGLHLVAAGVIPPLSGVTIQVLLPITFLNQGYSESIIKNIRLVVTGEKSRVRKEFLPAFELDMAAFVQQNKGLNARNVLGAFVGFLLEAKKAVKKDIVFTPKT